MSEKNTKKEIIRVIKFALFSASAGLIQIVSFTIFCEGLSLKAWIANLLALILSVLWNFTFNRKFTFKADGNVTIAMIKVAAFYLVFTPLSSLWTDYFVEHLKINEYIVLAFTMLTNFILEFIYTKYYVYRNNIDKMVKKEEIKNQELNMNK